VELKPFKVVWTTFLRAVYATISTIWLSIGLLQSEEFLARSGWPYFVEDGCEKKSPAG
jgi:hypothetical protein